MNLIDIGVNFHAKQLTGQAADLIYRAHKAGVSTIFATGTSLPASEAAVRLALSHPNVFATAGVHPHSASSYTAQVHEVLRGLWAAPKVVAVGEAGLDYNRMFSTKSEQRTAFSAQLEAALQCKKPLFLHCRDAFDDFHAMVKDATAAGATGVVHCFTGSRAEAEAYLDLGLDLGITGWVCDEARGQDLRQAVKGMPLDRIHVETDAPYLYPKTVPGTGRRVNEPALLPHVISELARIRGTESEAELALACTANGARLFRLPA